MRIGENRNKVSGPLLLARRKGGTFAFVAGRLRNAVGKGEVQQATFLGFKVRATGNLHSSPTTYVLDRTSVNGRYKRLLQSEGGKRGVMPSPARHLSGKNKENVSSPRKEKEKLPTSKRQGDL